ncbi:hypothetical protein [Clostridium sp. HBUAS56017]|uniref:hypothetical protein n=1 Tax=Clostridium sp. HBUAS56017 TaxID=2571128 RepID=UPI00117895C9|nr:hypothetical protein [Clostridium sp. HBUAS56017]
MDKEYVQASIEWFGDEIEWPEIPLDGLKFHPQIKFEEEGDVQPKWTVEVIIRRVSNNSNYYVDLKYLFEQAPHNLLRKGGKFVLFDGPNAIAKGEVMEDVLEN